MLLLIPFQRTLENQLNTPKSFIREVLQEQLLYPYLSRKVSKLIPEHFLCKIQFAKCLLQYLLFFLIINIRFTELISGQKSFSVLDWINRIALWFNGELNLELLQNNLLDSIEHLRVAIRRNMYFIYDGCSPHISVAVSDHLNNVFHISC